MRVISSLFFVFFAFNSLQSKEDLDSKENFIEYKPQDFSYLIGIPGFSKSQLEMHFTLYQGYVKNFNLIHSKVRALKATNQESSYDYGALKRRFGWEFNGMRLHELYFENLGGKGSEVKDSALYKKIVKEFGSYEAWKKDFIATGMIRGIGWVILAYDPVGDRLFNIWINEHDTGYFALSNSIVVMDVWEHAYITMWGLKRNEYIDAFFQNLNWEVALARFQKNKKCLETLH